MTVAKRSITALLLMAITIALGVTAHAQVPKDLAPASKAFIQKVKNPDNGLDLNMIYRLEIMAGVPSELIPLTADAELQTKLDQLKKELQSSAGFMLDTTTVPKSVIAAMVPLAQKLDGVDYFAGTADTPVGTVLLKASCGWLTAIGTPSKAKIDPLAAAETGEYVTGEVASLDELDAARYALTVADLHISETTRPEVAVFSSRFPLVIDEEPLSSEAKSMHHRALAFIRALVSQKLVTRFHWRVKELPFGVYGESVVSYRPPSGSNYVQSISHGYSIQYVTDGTIFAVAINRHPDVYLLNKIPKQTSGDRSESIPWFTNEGNNK